jgi:hypothetical protein
MRSEKGTVRIMRYEKWVRGIGRLLGWISAILILLMLVSGYGVTEYRVFNTLTFGYWSKVSSQQWHEWWGIPLLVSVGFHIGIAKLPKKRDGDQKERTA